MCASVWNPQPRTPAADQTGTMFGGREYPTIHDRSSLHDFIVNRLDANGCLEDPACALPDEAPMTPGEIGWMAGAYDGVMGHHMGGVGRDGDTAQHLAAAIAAAAARPSKKELAALYAQASADHVLSFIDPAIEALVAMRPSATAVGHVGAWLASESPDRSPVKVGIALLGITGAPDGSLLHVLGAHEEFTLYAVVAFSNSRQDPEPDLFALAKRVHGWGRIHCVERLRDTANPEIRRWILLDGFRNGVMNEYLAFIAATTGDLAAVLAERSPDRQLLTAAGDIIDALLMGGPAEDIDSYLDAPAVLERWLVHMDHDAATLGDLNTIGAIRGFCDRGDWEQRQLSGVWTADARAAVRAHADRLLSVPTWPGRVLAGLNSPDPQAFWYAWRGAQLLGIDAFDQLLARIDADPLDGPWFQAWQGADTQRAAVLADRAARQLDLELIASGASTAIGLGPEFKMHAALGWSLHGVRDHPGIGAPLVEAALVSPSIQNRNAALNVLEDWDSSQWTTLHRDRLRAMSTSDPDDKVRTRAAELLERSQGRA